MFVKPAPGLLIPDHDHGLGVHLPPEGQEVPNDPTWHRLLRDGDVVLADPAPATTAEV